MSKVIGFVMVGTNDLSKAGKFYDNVLIHIGLKRVNNKDERYIGYGHSKDDNEVKFYVTKPQNKKIVWRNGSFFSGNTFFVPGPSGLQKTPNKANKNEKNGKGKWPRR